jgi:hypothetical protein
MMAIKWWTWAEIEALSEEEYRENFGTDDKYMKDENGKYILKSRGLTGAEYRKQKAEKGTGHE